MVSYKNMQALDVNSAPGSADRSVQAWRLVDKIGVTLTNFRESRPPRHAFAVLAAVSVLLYAVAVAFSSSRQFWHDELYTFYIAQAPSIGQLWHELSLDLNPPLNYLAVRASMALFGTSENAARLPSMLAFFAGSACLYMFVSRRLGRLYGLLAALCFWAMPTFYLATEARPYALVLCFFALAMLAWQRAVQERRRMGSIIAFASATVGMAVCHFFVVFYIFPFGLAEVFRTVKRRRIDWPIWAALILPCLVTALFMKTIEHYASGAISWAFRASYTRTIFFYDWSFASEAPALFLCIAIAFLFMARTEALDRKRTLSIPELVLAAGLVVLPVVMNVVLRLIHAGFFERYSAPTAFGLAIFFVFIISRSTNRSDMAAFVCCCLLLIFFFAKEGIASNAGQFMQTRSLRPNHSEMARLESIDENLPLVAASGLTFLEMDKYEPEQTVTRLYYLTDRKLALAYAHAGIFEGFNTVKRFFPIRAHIEPFPNFVAQHHRFLVLGTPLYPEDWLIPVLLDQHASLKYLGSFASPYKDHELYEVETK